LKPILSTDLNIVCLLFGTFKTKVETVSVVWIKSDSIVHFMIHGFTILPPKVLLLSLGGAPYAVAQVCEF